MYAKQWVVQLNHTRHCAMDQSYITGCHNSRSVAKVTGDFGG